MAFPVSGPLSMDSIPPLQGNLTDFTFHNLMQGYKDELLVRVEFHGKLLGIFGCAPDVSDVYDDKKALLKWLREHNVNSILCIDSRRMHMEKICTPEQINASLIEPKVQADSLTTFYETMRLHCYSSFNDVDFALGDIWEISEAMEISAGKGQKCPDILINILKEEGTKGFLAACEKSGISYERHPDFFEHVANSHSGDHDYKDKKSFIDNLIFFPAIKQLDAFFDCMRFFYYKATPSFIHCAGGIGRTGFYLTYLIMKVAGCDFDLAKKIVIEKYLRNTFKDEIEQFRGCVETPGNPSRPSSPRAPALKIAQFS